MQFILYGHLKFDRAQLLPTFFKTVLTCRLPPASFYLSLIHIVLIPRSELSHRQISPPVPHRLFGRPFGDYFHMAASLPSATLEEHPHAARSQRISILIADETPMGCQLLKNALSHSRLRFEVVACAINRSEIMQSMSKHSVEVILVSESLQEGLFMGFQVLSDLRASFPSTRVIVLLKSAQRHLVLDAFRAGAKGVFCRAEPLEALCKCIRAVREGQIWANSHQLNLIVDALAHATPFHLTSAKGRYLLAKREHEVANLVAEGLTNRDIAQKLGLSEHTISNYLFRTYEKLGISSRVELVLYIVHHQRLHE
jgi:two-component system, NarL family, nitrate/nitrite response regulator NarL